MLNRLMAFTVSTMLLTGCSFYPWSECFETKPVEHIEEEILDETAEAALGLCGEDAHIEIDLNHRTDPKCMHCSMHCPKEEASL